MPREFWKLPFVGLALTLSVAWAQIKVPIRTFTDKSSGVSFDYPAVWKQVDHGDFYVQPYLIQGAPPIPPAKIIVEFLAENNYYSKTDLLGLDFVYVSIPQTAQSSCDRAAQDNTVGGSPQDSITVGGLSFAHMNTVGAAMCHETESDVYWVFRDSTCHLFEADLHTQCAGVEEGKRRLTKAETKALKRHLNDIVQSIRIAPKP